MTQKQTEIIAFINNKGGVSKTTSSVSVGSILASKGYDVLLVDLDAQANLTASLLKGEYRENLYTAMTGKSDLPIVNVKEHLDVVPASLNLSLAEIELSTVIAREMILSRLLQPLKGRYDFIILDCPPALGLMTINAFAASTNIIVPTIAEVLPFEGLKTVFLFIQKVKSGLNSGTKLLGVLITRYKKVKNSMEIETRLRSQLQELVFETKIRENTTVSSAPGYKQDIVTFDANCNGAKDYTTFTEELLQRLNMSAYEKV